MDVDQNAFIFSWEVRLRIALEAAQGQQVFLANSFLLCFFSASLNSLSYKPCMDFQM